LFLVILHLLYSLVLEQSYMEFDTLQGVTRPRIKNPREQFELPSYCKQIEGVHCHALDAEEIGSSEVDEVFVATKIKQKDSFAECTSDGECKPYQKGKKEDIFVANVEQFDLEVSAHVQAFNFYSETDECSDGNNTTPCPYAGSDMTLTGRLLGTNEEVLAEMPAGTHNRFPIHLWLKAAGFALDDQSDADKEDEEGKQTFRYQGAVVLVTISYSNRPRTSFFNSMFGHLAETTYEIRCQRVATADFLRRTEPEHFPQAGGIKRVVYNQRGVMFKFIQSGQVGRWSWSHLLNQFVMKLGMLALVQTVLDTLWVYVLPYMGYTDWSVHVFESVSHTKPAKEKDN